MAPGHKDIKVIGHPDEPIDECQANPLGIDRLHLAHVAPQGAVSGSRTTAIQYPTAMVGTARGWTGRVGPRAVSSASLTAFQW